MSPIVEHADVARTLLTMKALTQGARAITFACGHAIDRGHGAEAGDARSWKERANLLTPIAKAFATDVGVEVASLGIQVHGGMGYVEETGAARLLRDARIAPIYEGTNGIQAIDLVLRKLPLSNGGAMEAYIAELSETVAGLRACNAAGFGRSADALEASLVDLSAATAFLLRALAAKETETALSGATPFLRLAGLAASAAYLAKGALADTSRPDRIALARFMAENLLPETASLRVQVVSGAESLAAARIALQ